MAIGSLTEIYHLSNPEEKSLLERHPFAFYRGALEYCFNAEYTKLTERKFDSKRPQENIASIYRLNEATIDYTGDFQEQYEINRKAFNELAKSDFFKRQWALRNDKFSHAEASGNNRIFKDFELNTAEIKEGFSQLQVLLDISQTCSITVKHYVQRFYLPDIDTRTRDLFKTLSVHL